MTTQRELVFEREWKRGDFTNGQNRAYDRLCGKLFQRPPWAGDKPKTRADCPQDRPCPWLTCRYHLGNVGKLMSSGKPTLAERSNRPLWEMGCALDRADKPHTLDEVGEMMGMTREAVRQIEGRAIRKAMSFCELHDLPKDVFCDSMGGEIEQPETVSQGDLAMFERRLSEMVNRMKIKRVLMRVGCADADHERKEDEKTATALRKLRRKYKEGS